MKHPYSLLRDRRPDFSSEAVLEEHGRSWRKDAGVSDDYLVGFVGESWGTDAANQTPAVTEMQRRLAVAIEAAGDCAATQTEQLIKLTVSIKVLTGVLIGLGVVQTALMIWLKP